MTLSRDTHPDTMMTGGEFAECRAELEVSIRRLAYRIGVHWRTVSRWEQSDNPIPGPVAVLMRKILADQEEPADSRQNANIDTETHLTQVFGR